MESIALRIKELVEFKKMNISSFEKKIGVGNNSIGTLINRNSNVSGQILSKILNTFEDVSSDWLLTGKGQMLRSSNQNAQPVESLNSAGEDSDYRLIIEEQKNIITALKDQVEFYKMQHTTDNDTIDYIKKRTDDIYEFITTQEALREFDKIFEKAVQLGKDKAKEKGLEDLMNKIEALKK